MIKIIFKGLQKSELVKQATIERIQDANNRFPGLEECRPTVTLSMENSPSQAGPDVFTVKFMCQSGRYKGVIIERSAPNIYVALADFSENLLERLNRFGDKKRVKKIKQAREANISTTQFESPQLKYII